jgi:hypothetical protein
MLPTSNLYLILKGQHWANYLATINEFYLIPHASHANCKYKPIKKIGV